MASSGRERESPAYLFAEDSQLLREALRDCKGESSLEIGAGNAGILFDLGRRFRMVVGTDLVRPDPSPLTESKDVNFVLADRATCFKEGVFDLVAFNPPYTPSEGIEDRAVDGGRDGIEVPLKFLSEALRVVKRDGRVAMVASSDNPLEALEKECFEKGLVLTQRASRRLFYETLFVYTAERDPAPAAMFGLSAGG